MHSTPVGRGGGHLDELGRVCGHGSDGDVAREVSVWMEYERHDDGDVNPFPPEELAWILYWWYIKLCRLMPERGFRLLSNLKSLRGS